MSAMFSVMWLIYVLVQAPSLIADGKPLLSSTELYSFVYNFQVCKFLFLMHKNLKNSMGLLRSVLVGFPHPIFNSWLIHIFE